jgi:hypothetical protein
MKPLQLTSLKNYLLNCGLLLLPIMAWNIILASKLPRAYSAEVFWKDIPSFLANGENIFRLIIFIIPFFMPIQIETRSQKIGLWLYSIGTALYFLSWLAQIYFPQSAWSLNAFGFLAPAYTPLIWLAGIGLIGSTFYFPVSYRSWMYIILSIIFLGFHFTHAATVYSRILYS